CSSISIKVKDQSEKFDIFRRDVKHVDRFQKKENSLTTDDNNPEFDIDEEDTPKPLVRVSRNYKSVDPDIAIVNTSSKGETSSVTIQQTGITLSEFSKECESLEFVERFTKS